MTSSPRFRFVFVLGHSHSGSTLLGRLLDMHPRILCVGEMLRVKTALRSRRSKNCFCGELLESCPFWKSRLPVLAAVNFSKRRIKIRQYEEILASADSKEDVILDLSKAAAWKRTRRWGRPDMGYILLVRDSRGIVCSKKRVGKSVWSTSRSINKWMKRFLKFQRARGDGMLIVFYEDLISDLENELRRITDFLNIEYVSELIQPERQAHHFIHSSKSPYMKGRSDVRLDERWRRELSAEELERVQRMMTRIPILRDRYLGA